MVKSLHRRCTALLIAALVVVGLALVPTPAQADGDDDHDGLLDCPLGHYQQDYHPPLQPFTQEVTLEGTGSFGPCVSLSRPDLNNAEFDLDAVGDLNCLTGGNSDGIMRFFWNNGEVTRVEYPLLSLTIRPTGQTVAIVTGNIVSGPFKGGTMVFESNLITAGLTQCLTTGVDSAAGPATVAFVDL
jgi:hypothetical protein